MFLLQYCLTFTFFGLYYHDAGNWARITGIVKKWLGFSNLLQEILNERFPDGEEKKLQIEFSAGIGTEPQVFRARTSGHVAGSTSSPAR